MALQSSLNNNILSLLKTNNKGWNISLFQNKDQLTHNLCRSCHDISCNAVELGCDHQDTDIYLYCNDCLTQIIKNNHNKCPINNHSHPIIIPNRSNRRQISKLIINCPYSIQYKQQCLSNKHLNNAYIVDTIGGDEKEGIVPIRKHNNQNNIKIDGCQWKGTLTDILTTNHLTECAQKYDIPFTQTTIIKQLKTENKQLKQQIDSQKQKFLQQIQLTRQYHIMETSNAKITAANVEKNTNNIKLKLSMLQSQFNQQKSECVKLKTTLSEKYTEIKTLSQQLNDILNENERLQKLIEKGNKNKNDHEIKQNDNETAETEHEEFDANLMDKNIEIFNNNTSVRFCGKDQFATVYGTRIIPSMMDRTYVWKLKFIGSNANLLNIGIDNATAKWVHTGFHLKGKKAQYSCHVANGSVYSWNNLSIRQKCVPVTLINDIITMKVKFDTGNGWFNNNQNESMISYQINNHKEIIGFKEITRAKGLNYRLAISMSCKGNAVQLIDFRVLK